MTVEAAYVDAAAPDIIPTRSTIEHVQLRDILQPSSSKGKCLILNRLKVDEVDFNNPAKGARTFCTLDFRANCLVTAHGLLAAGGQSSELAIRPLTPARGDEGDSGEGWRQHPSRPVSPPPSSSSQQPAWLLRTPTGGSINNSISIRIDPPAIANYKPPMTLSSAPAMSSSSQPTSKKLRRHSRAQSSSHRPPVPADGGWLRDEPRHRDHDSTMPIDDFDDGDELGDFDDDGEEDVRRSSESSRLAMSAPTPPVHRVYVSNNDQTLKIFKLRPPAGANATFPGKKGSATTTTTATTSNPYTPSSLEGNLPGLSRSYTITFPTAVNHTSLSPDGRSLVAVGDTPDVFLYHRHDDGFFTKTATYQATSDASFSTSWHPDGTKFAVASQDGVISVWDVRSKHKLAEIKTAQSSTVGLLTSNGADGAARVVKFSPCGRFLAFTEHRLFFHIYDTQTYSKGQKIRIPTSVVGADGAEDDSAAARARRRLAMLDPLQPPFAQSFPESRERSGGDLRSFWRQLHLNGGPSGGAGGGAGAGAGPPPTRYSLDRASYEAEEANSGAGAGGSDNITPSATDTSPETAVRALRDAQRSLRSVRERLAYRAFQQVQRERDQRDQQPLLRRSRGTGAGSGAGTGANATAASTRTSSITSIERAALQRALAEGWQPQTLLDEHDDVAEPEAGAEPEHAIDVDGDYDDHDTYARERALSEEADATVAAVEGGGAGPSPGGSSSLPVLRAYSALYSPLGPLSGWPGPADGSGRGAAPTATTTTTTTTTTTSRLEEPLHHHHPSIPPPGRRPEPTWLPTALPSLTRSLASTSTSTTGLPPATHHHHLPFGSIAGLGQEEEAWHNIAGLCWDPDEKESDALYVASERLVVRYRVREVRRGSGRGEVR